MLHAKPVQRFRNELPAAAVERRIYHAEIVGDLRDDIAVDGLRLDIFEERLVSLLAHPLDEALFDSLVKVHAVRSAEDIGVFHAAGDLGSVLGRELRAVRPVDLIAVVLLGVVAGRDVDAGLRAVMPDGKAQLRRGPQRFKNAHMHAVRGHDRGGFAGKRHAVVAAVVADAHAALHRFRALGRDQLGKRLRRVTDDVDVHAVRAETHNAA